MRELRRDSGPAEAGPDGVERFLEAPAVSERQVGLVGLALDVGHEGPSQAGPLVLELVADTREVVQDTLRDREVFPLVGGGASLVELDRVREVAVRLEAAAGA